MWGCGAAGGQYATVSFCLDTGCCGFLLATRICCDRPECRTIAVVHLETAVLRGSAVAKAVVAGGRLRKDHCRRIRVVTRLPDRNLGPPLCNQRLLRDAQTRATEVFS